MTAGKKNISASISSKGRSAAGAEVVIISPVWSTYRVSVVGEADNLAYFKTQEFPTLQSEELMKSKYQVESACGEVKMLKAYIVKANEKKYRAQQTSAMYDKPDL